jgi:hypothetical protein
MWCIQVLAKTSITILKWIFPKGQPVRDDERRIFVTTTSTEEQRNLVLGIFWIFV